MKKTDHSNPTHVESEHTEVLDDTLTPDGLIMGDRRKAYEIISMNKQLLTNPNNDTESIGGEPTALMQGGRT
jgi:hypothetical protein